MGGVPASGTATTVLPGNSSDAAAVATAASVVTTPTRTCSGSTGASATLIEPSPTPAISHRADRTVWVARNGTTTFIGPFDGATDSPTAPSARRTSGAVIGSVDVIRTGMYLPGR